jgi:15-cis-phytoene synthase
VSSRSDSYAACRAIATRSNSSFPFAFRLLSPPKRRAMDALYAFMRVTDDLADEPGEMSAKRAALLTWRTDLRAALQGTFRHPIHAALADAVERYGIPTRYLFDAIDGVESDLEPVHFATFADLYPYCYRVASAPGLACVRIWGLRQGATFEEADRPAEAAGIAFQLTNILRDLGEDLARGRVYLPADELKQADCPPELWRDHALQVRAMVQAQAVRARRYYREADLLSPMLSPEGRGIFRVMCGVYRQLLDEVARAGERVLAHRVRVPRWRKGVIYLQGWAMKWASI